MCPTPSVLLATAFFRLMTAQDACGCTAKITVFRATEARSQSPGALSRGLLLAGAPSALFCARRKHGTDGLVLWRYPARHAGQRCVCDHLDSPKMRPMGSVLFGNVAQASVFANASSSCKLLHS